MTQHKHPEDMPDGLAMSPAGAVLIARLGHSLAHRMLRKSQSLLRVHGVDVEAGWRCPDCEHPASVRDYPRCTCANCGRPFPRRCNSVGCSRLVQPTNRPLTLGGGAYWVDPWPFCQDHSGSEGHVARDENGNPVEQSGRSARLDALTKTVPRQEINHAIAWQDYVWRKKPWAALQKWGNEGCGKVDGKTIAYLCDLRTGAGKTVAAVRFAYEFFVERGDFGAVMFCTEAELAKFYARQFQTENRDGRVVPTSYASYCRDMLAYAVKVPLLIVDEFGDVTSYGQKAKEEVGGIFRYRAEHSLPMLITSNVPPQGTPGQRSAFSKFESDPNVPRIQSRVLSKTLMIPMQSPVDLRVTGGLAH